MKLASTWGGFAAWIFALALGMPASTAFGQAMFPAASAPLPRWMVNQATPLPVLAHEQSAQARPYPDYFAQALQLTDLKADERFGSVRLRGAAHRHIVLPIQTEGFGFVPGFRALIAAELDHELSVRGVDANRQTDVLDAFGPLARRLDASVLVKLGDEHPSAVLLALYIGHDGVNKAFVTLERRQGSRTQAAYRDVALPEKAREAAAAIAAQIPALLDELQLGAPAQTAPGRDAAPGGCRDEAWELAQPAAGDVAKLACHAVVMGGLLPTFNASEAHFAPNGTPARLAWLATAYVEAAHWPGAPRVAQSVRELAWWQLAIGDAGDGEVAITPSEDPVVGRLLRMLLAHRHGKSSPARSAREATERLVDEAAKGLPPFARAVFVERGNLAQAFRRVDLCAIELRLPGAMPSQTCRHYDETITSTPGPAYAGQTAIYLEWWLAASHKDIRYSGATLGQIERLASVLNSMPKEWVRHPFIRQQQYMVEKPDAAAGGDFNAYLERLRSQATSFVQSTVDGQRYDFALAGHSLSEHAWVDNLNVLNDNKIAKLTDDEMRLISVLRFDRYGKTLGPANRRTAGAGAAFLAPGSVRSALMQAQMFASSNAVPQSQASAVAAARPASTPERGLFRSDFSNTGQRASQTEAQLRSELARQPNDMDNRVALAMLLLKLGRPEAKAREVIDGMPPNRRIDQQVQLSHTWAIPAHAYFFASDMTAAKAYYQRVRDIGTGSGSDMHARARLRQIERDLQGMTAATSDRLARYESDFTRRDLAGLMFMTGRKDAAWDVLAPRLASANTFQLWSGALVGQRIDQLDLKSVQTWLASRGIAGAQIKYEDVVPMYLHLYGVVDRVPTDGDIELLKGDSRAAQRNVRWVASAELARMVQQGSYAKFSAVRSELAKAWDADRSRFMLPMFTWAAWHATGGRDPELDSIRRTELTSDDFDDLLSQSLLLALEGRVDASLDFLRAARYQMSELGLGGANVDRAVPSPFEYARATYLMYVRTANGAYRSEALRFARAHQQMFPFWAWAYALEALLESDDKARTVALCRARYLDPSSYFLGLAQATPGAPKPACTKAPWAP